MFSPPVIAFSTLGCRTSEKLNDIHLFYLPYYWLTRFIRFNSGATFALVTSYLQRHTSPFNGILCVYVQLQRAHFLTVRLGNKRKRSARIFGSGDATIIRKHKHKLLRFAADMEMLPTKCSFHSASQGRTKDDQTACGAVNFKPPNTRQNREPVKLQRVQVEAHSENKYWT